ncbi:YcxB family protein [Luteimonas sp. A277]
MRTLRGIKRRVARLTLVSIAAVGFFYKVYRVGRCDFKVDRDGVSRRTKLGPGSVPWSRVKSVHSYSPGFLVELESGAMPVPFRALSVEQQSQFLLLAADKLSNGPKPIRGAS